MFFAIVKFILREEIGSREEIDVLQSTLVAKKLPFTIVNAIEKYAKLSLLYYLICYVDALFFFFVFSVDIFAPVLTCRMKLRVYLESIGCDYWSDALFDLAQTDTRVGDLSQGTHNGTLFLSFFFSLC
jgi:hypothetical protein